MFTLRLTLAKQKGLRLPGVVSPVFLRDCYISRLLGANVFTT